MMAVPGQSGREGPIISFIVDELRRAGLPAEAATTDAAHRRSRLRGEVGNLIVKMPGTTRGVRRLLCAHVDRVPICVGTRPIRRGTLIRSADPAMGLGADNRSGAAAVLTAAVEILRRRLPHPPLTLLFTVQEEVGLAGARHLSLSRLGRPRLAFNFDGGAPDQLTVGATGAYRLEIDIAGRASHAGVHPERGINAVTVAALAIARLQRSGWLGAIGKGRQSGTSNIGTIEGGQASNVVAPNARVTAEIRSHDPRFRKRILAAFENAFREAADSVRNEAGSHGRVDVASRLDYESFRLSPNEPCVRHTQAAVRDVGLEPQSSIANGGLDANWLTQRGIPTVSLGAGQHHAHTVDEVLDVSEYLLGCRVALHLATTSWPG